ncbi:glycosyltransferase family 2 protein [Clostridium aminobutyricum]|uniref:Glycosyltransferase n=1 Tax=Clostridium aminobutyricum TaxID=33953 RepID=A0A939DAA5_CLOAM|nr:glycosyltransferase family 2 protein [Clostridium aminobutyricum]MBN7774051.1 glycosyltransferase [Clostridium aminobutyricum]
MFLTQNNNSYSELPLVSIVTPSYNQGKFIRATIDSVLNQDYTNIEYIVVDGGSTDETLEILKEYGDKIKWVSEPDKGQADAVNKGISSANGDIIGWLNSDDTYIGNSISLMVQYFLDDPSVQMIYGQGVYTDKKGDKICDYPTEDFSEARLAEICYICQPTAFFKKEAAIRCGLLDVNCDMCMDYDLWLRMVNKGVKVKCVADYIATSRTYKENKTSTRQIDSCREACGLIYKYYRYVPIGWIYGYSKELQKKQRQIKFIRYIYLGLLFIKFNYRRLPFAVYKALDEVYRKTKEANDIKLLRRTIAGVIESGKTKTQ